jgi:hypothetical protein
MLSDGLERLGVPGSQRLKKRLGLTPQVIEIRTRGKSFMHVGSPFLFVSARIRSGQHEKRANKPGVVKLG